MGWCSAVARPSASRPPAGDELARGARPGHLLDNCCIPTVTGAILYDLANGGDKAWGELPPYRALAMQAAEAAGPEFALGNAGAGFGAIAGQIKGGLGTASAVDDATGITVAALVAVNPVGSVTMPDSSTMWAWHLEQAGEFGGQIPPTMPPGTGSRPRTASPTTPPSG